MIAVLSADVLPKIRMSVDDYLSADFPEGYRYELVEGVVQVAPVPDRPHDYVIERLSRMFGRSGDRRPDIVSYITQRFAVTLLDRETAREPDLGLYGPSESPRIPSKSWKIAKPLLVVEVVSPGQEARDYEDKRQDYWDAGVGEYWIADPQRETLTALVRGADGWIETVYDATMTYRPAILPGMEIRIAGLFE